MFVLKNWCKFLSCEYKKSPGALWGLKFSLWKQNTETTEQKETLDLLFSFVSAAQGGKHFHKKPVASETWHDLGSPAPKRRKALIIFFLLHQVFILSVSVDNTRYIRDIVSIWQYWWGQCLQKQLFFLSSHTSRQIKRRWYHLLLWISSDKMKQI